MCGIIGIVGKEEVSHRLLEGLTRLEYRGYDSAGVATVVNGSIDRRRAEGKIDRLKALIANSPIVGHTGIGHTRWATHGVPNETNAHPHVSNKVAVVHNGIIENFQELKDELIAKGHVFSSDTDTEAVVHLLTQYLDDGLTPREAMLKAVARFHGAFGLVAVFAGHQNLLVGARRGSPLAVGFGDGEMYLGSDALALSALTQKVLYLEEDDVVFLTQDSVEVVDGAGRIANRKVETVEQSGAPIGKGGYRHYMLKEIYEQPTVIGDTLGVMISPGTSQVRLPEIDMDLTTVKRLSIVGCGSSFYTGLVAKYWIENLVRIPVDVEIASEYRYRAGPVSADTLSLFISQSGETADTLAAMRYAKSEGGRTLAIVNVQGSTMAREADAVLRTLAGPEMSVASTKACVTQLTVLACLALALGRTHGTLDAARESALARVLSEAAGQMAEVLVRVADPVKELARKLAGSQHAIYLGRGTAWPIALEGALKLKELSYLHAEGYPAGELKHGPIALIDENMPVIVLAPRDQWFEKTASNVEEIAARRGKVTLISDKEGIARLSRSIAGAIEMPAVDPFIAPLLYSAPCQLLAYYVAVEKGTDVDQPRNLAKSVTVE